MLKLRTSGHQRHTEEVKRQVTTWEKVSAMHTAYQGPVS